MDCKFFKENINLIYACAITLIIVVMGFTLLIYFLPPKTEICPNSPVVQTDLLDDQKKVIEFEGDEANFLLAKYKIDTISKKGGVKLIDKDTLVYYTGLNIIGANTIEAVDLVNKTKKWTFEKSYYDGSLANVDLIDNKAIIIGIENDVYKLFAISNVNGRLLWTLPIGDLDRAKVIINNEELYILSAKKCYAVGCEEGDCSDFFEMVAKHDAEKGNQLYKIDSTTGKILWQYEYLAPKYSWMGYGDEFPLLGFEKLEENALTFSINANNCDGEKIEKNIKIDSITGKELK